MSHMAEDLPIWEEIYQKAFPTMIGMHNHRADGDHQRQGIDRSIVLENSKQILIDEKVRGKNKITGKVYEDIALEVWSDKERRVLGWVEKPLLADYIAYAIVPKGICYLLPVLQLQVAWTRHKEEWSSKYRLRESLNKGWTTVFCPIPPRVLYPAIGQRLRIEFQPVFDFMEN